MHQMRQMNSIDSIHYQLKYIGQMHRLNHAVIRNLYFIIFQNEPGAKATQVVQLKSFIASGGLDKIEKCKLGGGGGSYMKYFHS